MKDVQKEKSAIVLHSCINHQHSRFNYFSKI